MALSTTRLPPIIPGAVKIKRHNKSTVVHPFDITDNSSATWFPSAIGKSDVHGPNEVIPYIFGESAFKDMASAIRSATTQGHFIYLLGWRMVKSFELIAGDRDSTIESLFSNASAKGVDIRVMLNHTHSEIEDLKAFDNTPEVNFVNGLNHGAAINDQRVVKGSFLAEIGEIIQGMQHYVGMHHQKVLVVNGVEGLVAFQGGMDLNPDRLSHGGAPGLHDVHTRIRGLGAQSLWRIFIDRWQDHPESAKFSQIPTTVTDSNPPTSATLQVDIGRTFPNCNKHSLNGPGGPYKFAAAGDQSAKALVLNAIAKSKIFIYIEDQYLFDMSISDALKAALPNIKKLIILLCPSELIFDQMQPFKRRKAFIDNLTGGAPPPTDKVIVCQSTAFYVHSKSFIFDDKFAITGSANLTRRGYSHDSEQNAGIFDPNPTRRFFFAHELRMNLWAKHLNLDHPIDLVDPIASSVHWSSPIGKIATYKVAGQDPPSPAGKVGKIFITDDMIWNSGLDPDGS